MSQFFAVLDAGIVVTMGPCGFIPAWLWIFRPYLGTPIPIFKLPIGKWFRSLCPCTVTWLRWVMVGWLVGSVWLAVSLLRLSPIGVVIRLDSASKLSMQARKYFALPALIILLTFFSIVFLASTVLLAICFILFLAICSILLFAIFRFFCLCLDQLFWLHLVQLFCLQLQSYFSHFHWKGYYDLPRDIPLSTITIDSNARNVIQMCSILFRIRCLTFGFFMKTINMFSHVSANGMYLFYLRFLHTHNIFNITDRRLLYCPHEFKC